MKNKTRLAIFLLIGLSLLAAPFVASAVPITVPSAPGAGYLLESTSTGAYIATTSPIITGNFIVNGFSTFATTTTGSFNGSVTVSGWPYAQTSMGIQTAINVCALSISCGTVSLSAGTYSMSSSLTMGGRNNIRLIGQGASSTILQITSGFSGSYIIDDTSKKYDGITISGIAFDSTAKTQVAAIRLGQISNCYITNNIFSNIQAASSIWGIKIGPSNVAIFDATQYVTNCHFDNNIFLNDNFGTEEGLLAVQWQNSSINGNYITTSTSTNAYILLCYIYCDNVQMDFNKFNNSGGHAIGAQQSARISMDNNNITMTGSGYRALTTVNVIDSEIKDNMVNGGGTAGVGVYIFDRDSGADGNQDLYATTTNLEVSGNTFDSVRYGILMTVGGIGFKTAQSGISFHNNTFYNIGSLPIDVGYDATNGDVYGSVDIFDNNIQSWQATGETNVGAIRLRGASSTVGTLAKVRVVGNYIAPTSAPSGSAVSIIWANPSVIAGNYVIGTNVGGARTFAFTNGPVTTANAQAIYGNIKDSTTGFSWENDTGTREGFVDSSGRLGLATSSPDQQLTVNGNIDFVAGNNGNFLGAYSGANSIFDFSRQATPSNASLDISAFGGIGFASGVTTPSASTTYSALITSAGNFGISTSTPGSLLSIGNNNGINFTTATTSFSSTGGINLSSGCFSITGNCLSLSNFGGTLAQSNGGTGVTAIGANMLLANNGSSAIVATSSPTFANFNATSTTATSTAANGINITGGCFSVSSTCISGGSGTVNVGTTGQIAYYAANTSAVSGTSTIFITTGNLVSVGTNSSPTALFTVSKTNGSGDVAMQVQNNSGTLNETASILFSNSTSVGTISDEIQSKRTDSPNSADSDLIFDTRGSGSLGERMRISSIGNVGIGTSSPTAALTVQLASSTLSTATAFDVWGLMNTVEWLFQRIDEWGNLIVSGPQITLTSCTGGTVAAASNQRAGSVTIGTGLTSCGVLFPHPYPSGSTVHVFLNQDSGTLLNFDAQSISTTGFTITAASIATGDIVSYNVIATQ